MERIADAHLDLCHDLLRSHRAGEREVLAHSYLPQWRQAGVGLIVAAIYLDTRGRYEEYYPEALAQLAALEEELTCCSGAVLCRTGGELEAAWSEDKVALLLSLEGAEPLGEDLGRLEEFYRRGVRALGLCWSRENAAGFGGRYEAGEVTDSIGLKSFGCALVRRAEELGVLIDVSHLNDGGCADVARLSRRPFFASHSNARALRNMDRNLSDAALEAIARSGGMVGVNSYSGLVSGTTEQATVAAVADHADYVGGRIGWERVGLGLDLMGRLNGGDAVFTSGGVSMRGFDILPSHTAVEELDSELARRGCSDCRRAGILGKNWMDFFRENLE